MRIGMMAAVVGLVAGSGFGGAVASGENAALGYYRAWSVFDQQLPVGLDSLDGRLALSADGPGTLAASDGVIDILLESAARGDADWDVDLSDGPMTLLPHLGMMRRFARLMAADALASAADGARGDAAARVAALYRMSAHTTSGDTLISTLVGLAMGNLANQLTGQLIDDGVIRGDEARVVLDAIGGGDADDRYGLRDAVVGEWRMISEYILKHAPDEDPGVWLVEEVGIATDGAEGKRLLAMSREDLLREIGGYAAYHGALLSAMDSGDRAGLAAVSERLKDGDYGDLSLLIAPAVTRAYELARESKSQTDALIRRLEGIAN